MRELHVSTPAPAPARWYVRVAGTPIEVLRITRPGTDGWVSVRAAGTNPDRPVVRIPARWLIRG